jgi:hypothetical protein
MTFSGSVSSSHGLKDAVVKVVSGSICAASNWISEACLPIFFCSSLSLSLSLSLSVGSLRAWENLLSVLYVNL